ncbi:helix-turn-helix transcriptional regulator [Vagococcus fluvialis]|uniref:helix-turn-helix transcriptional regulator n=1 Tax=Vagococcus fluvialis TaxID=2738 RepID=UPI001D0A998F|nr:transcriptional regulator [Vagococcus fluvialis]UDM74021.1 transcriptional regulator [Vagococcus fluvialis]
MSKIAKMRKFMGLTQTDVASILGISLQSYYKKENKKTPFNDNEKIAMKNLFKKSFPKITIDEIFFD